MARPPTLRLVPDTPPTAGELSELREAVRRMKTERDLIDEFSREMARMLRAQYNALVAEGFTPAQALAIVKEQGKR